MELLLSIHIQNPPLQKKSKKIKGQIELEKYAVNLASSKSAEADMAHGFRAMASLTKLSKLREWRPGSPAITGCTLHMLTFSPIPTVQELSR